MEQDIIVLIVDDNPDNLFATERIVQKEGYQVIKASNGKEAPYKSQGEQA